MSERQNNDYSGLEHSGFEKLKDIHRKIQTDLRSSVKSDDTEDHFETVVYGPPSMILTHVFIRLGIGPNTVTMLSLLFGVCGSLFFFSRNPLINFIGIVIEYIAIVLDCSDGQVARLTNSGTQFGRFLDGLVDSVNFIAVYAVLGLRMMLKETIPFTSIRWYGYVWIALLVSGYFHAEQARMADYFRSLHLSFQHQHDSAVFTSSKKIKEEIAESKDTPLYNKIYLRVYYLYTRAQEKATPCTQRLLNAIEDNGGHISEELAEAFISKSRRYVQLTNVLTLNLRAYTLYLLILLRLHAFFFPFNIIVLGAIMIYMIAKYEKIAREVCDQFFADSSF